MIDYFEKLNRWEVVALLLGAALLGTAQVVVDSFVYKPCHIPLSFKTVDGRAIASFGLLVIYFVGYMVLGRLPWFKNSKITCFLVSFAAGISTLIFVVWYWCY